MNSWVSLKSQVLSRILRLKWLKLLLAGMCTAIRKETMQRGKFTPDGNFSIFFLMNFAWFPSHLLCHHLTISIRVGMPWITELGLSARALEGCTLETKIQDPNHIGNDQNTGIMFSLFFLLVFPFFFLIQFVQYHSGIRQQVSTKEDQ